MQTLKLAGIAFPILLVLDLFWIGVAGSGFYQSELGTMLRPDILWPAALAFYVIYALALAFFVLRPAITEHSSLVRVFRTGAFFGLAAYAAYDLTNLATLAGWPVAVTFIDLAWGAVATAVVSGITFIIATKLLRY